MATFNDAALSKLTAKIDSKLAESKKTKGKDDTGKRKREQTADTAQPPPKKRNAPKSKPNSKPGSKPSSKPNGDNAKSKPRKERTSEAASVDVLLQEIKALGGDEDDLKLVGDIDSDDEEINNHKEKNADKSLRAELAKFAAGLGFEKVNPESTIEESEANVDEPVSDEVDEEGDEDEDDHQSSEGSSAPVQDTDEKPLRDPKRKTVSKPL